MSYENQRNFLKSNFSEFKKIKTDKMKGRKKPAETKGYDSNFKLIDLPKVSEEVLKTKSIYKCIEQRRSTRFYSQEEITIDELSYLLWSTQGITGKSSNGLTLRTVPCSGATHTFETYLFIKNVEGLEKGVYRYLAVEHKLLFISTLDEIDEKVDQITLDQPFVANFAKKSAVLFVWSTIPYRSEWKFDITAHKKILIDVGHICQNLYLSGESIDVGTCAIGIYDQKMIDNILNLNTEEEFVIYMAAIGKKIK